MLRRVGDVLLDPSQRSTSSLKRWLVGRDAFDLAEKPARLALYQVNRGGPPLPGNAECAQHALCEGQKLGDMHYSMYAKCACSAMFDMCICTLQRTPLHAPVAANWVWCNCPSHFPGTAGVSKRSARYPVTHWGAEGGHHCYSLGVQEAHRLDEHLQDHSGKPCNVHSLDAPAGMFQQLLQIP